VRKISFMAKNAIKIGSHFCARHRDAEQDTSSGLIYVDFKGFNAVQSIKRSFFHNVRTLTHVDLTGLKSIKDIGQYFFFKCIGLESVKAAGLPPVRKFDNGFNGEISLTFDPKTPWEYIEIEPLLRKRYPWKAPTTVKNATTQSLALQSATLQSKK
ncbi:MAG: hypothetical protein Q8K36_04095, partial [Alphaproteobacteria bacterium]|nr:hypothetical protein [Alphaproteobacteria bacterium]